MREKVRCVNCGTVYEREVNSWIEQTRSVITTITCPNCGSINCVKADTNYEEGG